MRNWENPFMLACNTATNKNPPSHIINLIIIIFMLCPVVMSQFVVPDSDADCLLKFKKTLSNGADLASWDPLISPCEGTTANWFGLLCSNYVWGIQLEGMGLTGTLDLEPLVPMKNLRTISVMNNEFNGPMPQVKRFSSLRSLYLSNNRFSGEITGDAFEGMPLLKKILMANNAFRGKIPESLATLPMLIELRLNGNQFQGQIPDFQQRNLKIASFENNDLDGMIPESLQNMDPGSFAGNKDLCGRPLSPCSLSAPSIPVVPVSPDDPKSLTPPPMVEKNRSFYTLAIILSVIGIILVIIALVFCFVHSRRRKCLSAYPSAGKERIESYNYHQPINNKPVNHTRRGPRGTTSDHPSGKLLFLRDDIQRFDLQDLLKASAEVLGSGTFGASYKAEISIGQTFVVKRYKQMNNVGRDEFHTHMRRLGSLNHPNILPLVAYYYRREEKLLVTQFMPNTSLASHLHANQSAGLDWMTRLKITKGVAKGLGYLFNELPTLTIPHGHIKSSNIILNESFEPLLTDYALRPVMSSDHAHNFMTAYKSPGQSTTKKTDVWCFGILILEILTGRFPEDYLTQGYDQNMSLVTWVNGMVKEKKTGDVFDKEMKGTKNCKGEMISLLKIGLRCCEEDEERRVEMSEAVEMIKMLREGEDDGDYDDDDMYPSTLYDDDDDDFGSSMSR